MNLFIKQTHTHREQICCCQGGGGWGRDELGVQDQQMQMIIYKMDKQQGPTLQHRELYSISCDNHTGKKYEEIYIYIHTHTQCHTAEINTTL